MTRLRAPVAFLSGAVLTLAFPEPDLWPLAWVAIAPFLWAARGAGGRRGAWLGFLFGLGFFGVLLIWIKYVGWLAWAVLLLLQSAYMAAFGAAWGGFTKRFAGFVAVLAGAGFWVAAEYLRQVTPVVGFPWGQLAQSQHNMTWMLRYASFAGGWTISFVIVALNGLLLLGIQKVRARHLRLAAMCGLGYITLLALPLVSLYSRAHYDYFRARVAIVQGNVPRDFAGTITEKDSAILNSHVALTNELAGKDVDLVIWPESSVGLDMNRLEFVQDSVERAARSVRADMVIGGNQDIGRDRYKVIAYHVSDEGDVLDIYQKTHLVPFGEYVPWRAVLGWLPMLEQIPRDAVPGSEDKSFELEKGRAIPVISFEGDFGSLVRKHVDAAGGGLLVVATNTSTWETSWASAQHLAFSQVRAAENRVYVAHAALSGVSAFIAPDGQVIERTEMWTRDTLVGYPAVASGSSFYTRTGDWLPLLCLIGSLVALVAARRPRPGSVGSHDTGDNGERSSSRDRSDL